jgi:uncharacterized protein with PIN domain
VFHLQCIRAQLTQETGPRIEFGFARCPACATSLVETDHPLLKHELAPIKARYENVSLLPFISP